MLVLASQSPRRREILKQAGIAFTVRAADVDESVLPGEAPEAYVMRLAEWKARAIAADKGDIVLGADTTVVVGHQILGKPEDPADALRMLELLSGRCHEVMTGICLKRGDQTVSDFAMTSVWFSTMSSQEMEDYVASGEPVDKAGAYAIQGLASKYIEKIEGCYFNVVGLPVSLVYRRLQHMG